MKFPKNLLGFLPCSKCLSFSRTHQKGKPKFLCQSSLAPSIAETGQSSKPINASSSSSCPSSESQFLCEICAEPKSQNESFNSKGCSHGFCSDCIAKYISLKIQDRNTSISCPEPTCKVVLEPEFCRPILPPEVFDRWNRGLSEFMMLGSHRFYCPHENCSSLLLAKKEKKSECPHCNRSFCGQCKVPWHEGMKCGEFQRSRRADAMVMKLVKKRKWKRCPKCSFYVEKNGGCRVVRCRCGCAFCYRCAAPTHDDICSNC